MSDYAPPIQQSVDNIEKLDSGRTGKVGEQGVNSFNDLVTQRNSTIESKQNQGTDYSSGFREKNSPGESGGVDDFDNAGSESLEPGESDNGFNKPTGEDEAEQSDEIKSPADTKSEQDNHVHTVDKSEKDNNDESCIDGSCIKLDNSPPKDKLEIRSHKEPDEENPGSTDTSGSFDNKKPKSESESEDAQPRKEKPNVLEKDSKLTENQMLSGGNPHDEQRGNVEDKKPQELDRKKDSNGKDMPGASEYPKMRGLSDKRSIAGSIQAKPPSGQSIFQRRLNELQSSQKKREATEEWNREAVRRLQQYDQKSMERYKQSSQKATKK